MRLLDLNVRGVVDVPDNKVFHVTSTIDREHVVNLSYQEYARMFDEIVAIQKPCEENMVFLLILKTTDLLNEDDLRQYHQTLVSSFCASILSNDRRKIKDVFSGKERDIEENDFMIGKLPNVFVPLVTMRKISLFATKTNRFNIILQYNNKVMDMTGGYYELTD